jgi:hypothetical protein
MARTLYFYQKRGVKTSVEESFYLQTDPAHHHNPNACFITTIGMLQTVTTP